MKRIVLFGLATLLVAGLGAYAAPEDTAPTETPEQELAPGQARVVIPVKGMTCGGCCVPVETAVKTLEGVVAAKADYEKGQATVTYEEEKLNVEKIVEVINTKTKFKASLPKKKVS